MVYVVPHHGIILKPSSVSGNFLTRQMSNYSEKTLYSLQWELLVVSTFKKRL